MEFIVGGFLLLDSSILGIGVLVGKLMWDRGIALVLRTVVTEREWVEFMMREVLGMHWSSPFCE